MQNFATKAARKALDKCCFTVDETASITEACVCLNPKPKEFVMDKRTAIKNTEKTVRNVLGVKKPTETKRFGGVNVCYDKA